ncbi:DUF1120 domain-containing protein [Pseudomonas sp. NPDC098747]|uniref:DUF1120 domain-containing protein n=1 Tax=Pseudomonas sp. NPDC098747 TaxID=3364487 RepID=UPI00383BD19B
MKKLLLPLALAFASNAAVAANSVDLRVTGTITPAACNITLLGGNIDYGELDFQSVSNGTAGIGQNVFRSLNITCSGSTQIAFKAIDNRQDSVPAGETRSAAFGLGFDNSQNPIGIYLLDITGNSITTDSVAGAIDYSDDNGVTWRDWSGVQNLVNYNKSPRLYAFDLPSNLGGQPLPIMNGTVEFKANTVIKANSLDSSTEIIIDGSATFELVYL